MIQRDGYYFPDADQMFHRFHFNEFKRDIPWFLEHVPGRDNLIQAGAAVGMYPLALAQHFQSVTTFEPNPEMWECLQANRKARDCLGRLMALQGGLCDQPGWGRIERPELENAGANRVELDQFGKVELYTIDSFDFRNVSAIWLDIEGLELAALRGAEQTIRRWSPVIVTEENGNGAKYGIGPTDVEDWLETLGYEVEGGIGRDRLYRKTS